MIGFKNYHLINYLFIKEICHPKRLSDLVLIITHWNYFPFLYLMLN